MNSLRTDTGQELDWQLRHWQLRVDYCELLADLHSEYDFLLNMFLDLCDLLSEEGFITGCEFPLYEQIPKEEVVTCLLDADEVSPVLPPIAKHLRVMK